MQSITGSRWKCMGITALALVSVLLLVSFYEPVRNNFEMIRPPRSSWMSSFVALVSPYTSKRYFLSMYAMFRNEATLVSEWVDHYRRLGVDHFFLIDHGPSSDDTLFMLRKEIQAGLVTVFTYTDRSRGAQVRAYKEFFPKVREETEWIIQTDLDEFLISRNPETLNASIPEILQKHFADVSFISVPDLYFGSSGHETQPLTVLCNFLKRANYDTPNPPGFLNPTLTRYLARTDDVLVDTIQVNNCATRSGAKRRTSLATNTTFEPPSNKDRFWISERDIATAYFAVNHYRILSWEWYLKVRAKRGNVATGTDSINLTAEAWRQERDTYDAHYNAIVDTLLASQTPYCPRIAANSKTP